MNQENISQGKVGLAVLKTNDRTQCKIIIYRTKQNVLANISLILGTSKIFVKNECAQCQDDEQNYWSIVFESNDIDEVLKEIDLQYLVRDNQVEIGAAANPQDPEKIEKSTPNTNAIPSKASILSRMAKMGKPLPQLANSTTEISDSSDQDDVKLPPIAHPRRTMNKVVSVKNFSAPVDCATAPIPIDNRLVAYNNVVDTVHETIGLNVLLAENRTQNTEMRMNLSKLETKIEKVLDKIDLIDIGGRNNQIGRQYVDREAEELELEGKVLELKKENRQLRLRVSHLTEQCSNVAANHRKDQLIASEERIRNLEADAERIKSKECELIEMVRVQQILEDEVKQHVAQKDVEIDQLTEDLRQASARHEVNLKELECAFEKSESERNRLQHIDDERTKDFEDLQRQCEMLKEQNKALELDKDKASSIDSVVKSVMNGLYQKLHIAFGEKDTYTQMEILKMTGAAIKSETLAVLKKK